MFEFASSVPMECLVNISAVVVPEIVSAARRQNEGRRVELEVTRWHYGFAAVRKFLCLLLTGLDYWDFVRGHGKRMRDGPIDLLLFSVNLAGCCPEESDSKNTCIAASGNGDDI